VRGKIQLIALLAIIGCGDSTQGTPEAGTEDSGPDAAQKDSGGLYRCSEPGKPCNAHDPCAINPTCGKDFLCRPTSRQDCSDNLSCTVDTCLGQGRCSNTPKAGTCKLSVRVPKGTTCQGLSADGGVKPDAGGKPDAGAANDAASADATPGPMETIACCFNASDRHPTDTCKQCTPPAGDAGGGSATNWSPVNGGACDDGDACTHTDVCKQGICQGTSYASKCSDGKSCTKDLCDGKGGCLGNPINSDACLIDGTCYKKNDTNPSGGCSTCLPSKSQTVWTPLSNSCLINNKCYAKGAQHPGKCAECDPAVSASRWTVTVTTHCLVHDTCVTSGTKDPTPGSCASCQPSKDRYAYTPDAGYCKIQGTCYKDGTAHPEGCATCKVSSSTTGWTVTNPTTDCLLNNKCAKVCGTQCVDIKFNAKHCGKCSNPCTTGQICDQGKCVTFTPDWAVSMGSTSADAGRGLTVDSAGTVHVTGEFQSYATFGTTSINSSGGKDIFVVTLDRKGAFSGAMKLGGSAGDSGSDVALDGSGNRYVSGYFSGTATMGSVTLKSSGNNDAFVVRLLPSGAVSWAQRGGSGQWDHAMQVTVDGSGNSYWVGHAYAPATFGTLSVSGHGASDIFVAKSGASGALDWVRFAGGSGYELGASIAVDRTGASYVTGYFKDSGTFGSYTLSAAGASEDVFVAKLSSSGSWLWAVSAGGTGKDKGKSVMLDSSGNVYVAGLYTGPATFGSLTLPSRSGSDVFVARLNASGGFTWVSKVGATGAGSIADEDGTRLAIDGSGRMYVAGFYTGSATFGSTRLASSGSEDVFVARFDTSGTFTWARGAGGGLRDEARDVAVDQNGTLYVTGLYTGGATFGTTKLNARGSTDIFVWKIKP
jgi:hypothetical protein